MKKTPVAAFMTKISDRGRHDNYMVRPVVSLPILSRDVQVVSPQCEVLLLDSGQENLSETQFD